ncbi:hypothetical protein, partial [Nocardia sp. NPDC019302]|uniref:hypothetical protein n=1 Tax=Nocardia sp. NPDC019302 TaxID=3154592 RepID=UPI0033C68C51
MQASALLKTSIYLDLYHPDRPGGQVVAGSNPVSPTEENPFRTASEGVFSFVSEGPDSTRASQNLTLSG